MNELSNLVWNSAWGLLFVVIFIIVIFFAVRELLCWYWKIDQWLALFEKNLESQNKIIWLLQDVIIATLKNWDEISKNNNSSDLSWILKEIQNDKNSIKFSMSKDSEIINE